METTEKNEIQILELKNSLSEIKHRREVDTKIDQQKKELISSRTGF